MNKAAGSGTDRIAARTRKEGGGIILTVPHRDMLMTWAEWDELLVQVAELRKLPEPKKRHRMATRPNDRVFQASLGDALSRAL